MWSIVKKNCIYIWVWKNSRAGSTNCVQLYCLKLLVHLSKCFFPILRFEVSLTWTVLILALKFCWTWLIFGLRSMNRRTCSIHSTFCFYIFVLQEIHNSLYILFLCHCSRIKFFVLRLAWIEEWAFSASFWRYKFHFQPVHYDQSLDDIIHWF